MKEELKVFTHSLLDTLYHNELEYTNDVYDQIQLSYDVKKFIRYNANKALQNLGFDSYFEEEEMNPIVINGLSTKSKSHDFFSMKGNSYKMAIVEPIRDDDFVF
jgi:ribonucleoside-diphosphate reductase beta chain